MKIFTISKALLLLALSANVLAIDYKDNKLKAASIAIEHEKMVEEAKENPQVTNIEAFCLKIAKVRLGNSYEITISDRKVPQNKKIVGDYSIAGKATQEPQVLTFLCKVSLNEDNHKILKGFKLYEVKRTEGKEVN